MKSPATRSCQIVFLVCAHIMAVTAGASPVVWIEAENYESQRGSTAPKFTLATASGGACVDSDWGGQASHFLRYKLVIASDFPALHVTLRYARATAGDSLVSVAVDGDTNLTKNVQLPPTGDWGFKAEGWNYAAVQLPAVAKGAHTLVIRSLADRNNVNFDGFYLSAEPLETNSVVAEPPSGPEAIAPLGEGLFPLPCKTPIALPSSRRKAFVAGSGLVQSLLSTPELRPGPLGGGIRLRHTVRIVGRASASFDLQFLGDGLSPNEARGAAAKVWAERLAPAAVEPLRIVGG